MSIFVPGAFWHIFSTNSGVKFRGNAAIFHRREPVFWLLSHFWPAIWARRVTKPRHSSWQIVSRFARSRQIQNRTCRRNFMVQNVRRLFSIFKPFFTMNAFLASGKCLKCHQTSLQLLVNVLKINQDSVDSNLATWQDFRVKITLQLVMFSSVF